MSVHKYEDFPTDLPYNNQAQHEPIVSRRSDTRRTTRRPGSSTSNNRLKKYEAEILSPHCIQRPKRFVTHGDSALRKLAKSAYNKNMLPTIDYQIDKPGVITLTAERALQVFYTAYALDDPVGAAVSKFNSCLTDTNAKLNKLNPRIPIQLGEADVYSTRGQRGHMVYWHILNAAGGDMLFEENMHIIEGFEHDTDTAISQPFYTPLITAAITPSKADANTYRDALAEVSAEHGPIQLLLGKSALQYCPSM